MTEISSYCPPFKSLSSRTWALRKELIIALIKDVRAVAYGTRTSRKSLSHNTTGRTARAQPRRLPRTLATMPMITLRLHQAVWEICVIVLKPRDPQVVPPIHALALSPSKSQARAVSQDIKVCTFSLWYGRICRGKDLHYDGFCSGMLRGGICIASRSDSAWCAD